MVTLSLVRIDHRLIHGQVMTMWSKAYPIDHILAIDDPLAADPFMKEIYEMAVPSSLKVEMLSVEEAIKKWKENQFESGNYLVLIRDVETALRAWEQGFGIHKLQVGNLVSSSSKILHKNSRLSPEHLPFLNKMQEGGVEVYVQSVPTDRQIPISEYLQKD